MFTLSEITGTVNQYGIVRVSIYGELSVPRIAKHRP